MRAETQKTCSNGTLIRPRRGSGSPRPIGASPRACLHDPAPGSPPSTPPAVRARFGVPPAKSRTERVGQRRKREAYQLAASRGAGSRGRGRTPGPPGSSRPQPAAPPQEARRPRPAGSSAARSAPGDVCYPWEMEDRRRLRCGLGVRCAAVLPKQVTKRLDLALHAAAGRKAQLDRELRRRGMDIGSTCGNLLEEMRELAEIRSHEHLQNCISSQICPGAPNTSLFFSFSQAPSQTRRKIIGAEGYL